MLEAIEIESLAFYELNFGNFLEAKDVFDSFLFKQMNLEQILEASENYGIDVINESHMLWIPQYLFCLPVPTNWKRKKNPITNQTTYYHIIHGIEIDFHPVEPFADQIIAKAR